MLEHGPRLRITHERFAQVETYFDRHGGKTILIGRFIGLVRALAPFIAGSSGMRYRAMAPYSILGTGLWASFFTLLGYFAAQNLDAVFNAAERGFLCFAVLVGVIVVVIVAVRYLRVAENRERAVAEMEERRWLRPLLAPRPAGALPLGAAHPGRPRDRADRAAGGARRRQLRLHLLRDRPRRQPGADRWRSDRARHRRRASAPAG